MANAPFLRMESTPDYKTWETAVKKFPEKNLPADLSNHSRDVKVSDYFSGTYQTQTMT